MSSNLTNLVDKDHWLDHIIARHQSRWIRAWAVRAIVRDIARHPEGLALACNPSLLQAVDVALRVAGERSPHYDPAIVARRAILMLLGMRSGDADPAVVRNLPPMRSGAIPSRDAAVCAGAFSR